MVARVQMRMEKKDLLMRRASLFTTEDFIERRVVSLLPEVGGKFRRGAWLSEIVRAKGTGRLTLRYQFEGGHTVYAKVYTDELGQYSFRSLSELWKDGFGHFSEFHVPEPLGFYGDENFLVMREVQGEPLAKMLSGTVDEITPAIRAAARWLVRLHASHIPSAIEESPCERIKIFKLSDMLAKASASYPEQAQLLLDLLQRVRRVAPTEPVLSLVPTHGQYTPANVFLNGAEVTVIDLDRICLSDPAKDVAMFVHRLRNILYKHSGDTERAEVLAAAFVSEYKSGAPSNLTHLPYYTALFSLKGFAKIAKDLSPLDPARQPLEDFYLKEFARYLDDESPTPRLAEKERIRTGEELKGTKEELGRWVVTITDDDFIGRHVFPTLGQVATRAAVRCETTVVQNTGTGRLTLRYHYEDGQVCYAKLYTDGLGWHSYLVNTRLWQEGFNQSSRYQVPEPLAFLREHNLFLMRGVRGRPLADALSEDVSEFTLVEGARDAARWLAALHRSRVQVGEVEPDWDSLKIFRVCVRLIKAAAARPEMQAQLLDLMHGLKLRVHRLPSKRAIVQTHGRFHHDHVFIGAGSVSIIDLDRSRPTDPAKDLAEFLRVLRMASFKRGLDLARANEASRAFLEEYLALVPEAELGLPVYWSAFLWLSLFGTVKKFDVKDPRGRALFDFHLQEMERALELKL